MKRVLLIISFLVLSVLSVRAQGIIVTGRLTSSVDGSPISNARIFVFKTVGEGKEFYEMAVKDYDAQGFFDPAAYGLLVREFSSYSDGSYEATNVIEKGSIVYLPDPFKPLFEKVNGRETIDVVVEATQMLEESSTTAQRKKKTKRGTKPKMTGKSIDMTRYYYLKKEKMGDVEGVGKSNARLVAQAYIVNSDGTDTIHYFEPRVYTGEQFQKTQKHWKDDYLFRLSDSIPRLLTESTDSIHIPIKYEFDDPTVLFYCNANVWIEDYLYTYYYDTLALFNTGRVSRPFQFLEYSFDQCEIDRENPFYKKLPKKEKVATPKNMKLKFVPSSAELNRKDEATMAALDSLKDELDAICSDPYSQLKELHFKGYSSPDGQYVKNVPLSKERTRNVFHEIFYGLPRWAQDKVFHTDTGFVATWEEVATLMEKDSLVTEAAEMRELIAKNPNNMDAQWSSMLKLPYYKTTMAKYRDELRSVKCEYITEVFRELEPHEILEKYQDESQGFKTGKRFMTLNEYWHLFEMVKNEKELESLYIRAKRHAWNTERKEWALPNNKLAIMYLKRKQVDTTLLAPFIDEKFGPNQEIIADMSGTKAFVNDDAIVANQVQMLMLAGKYDRAEEISSIIENEHPMLRAIVRCLGGFIDYEDEKEKPTIDLIRQSSPRNEVIVNLYMAETNPELYDSTTVAALNRLNQNDPLTHYLRAQRLCLKFQDDHVEMRNQNYDRAKEDPYFKHPNDEIIPAATPEDIELQKAKVEECKGYIEEDIAMFGAATDYSLSELKAAEDKLNLMLTGEEKVNPCECTVYDAVYQYLRTCFGLDRKFIKTAQADWDINEEILKKVLEDMEKEATNE